MIFIVVFPSLVFTNHEPNLIPPCSSSGVHANADQGAFGIHLLCQLCHGLWGRLGFCKVPCCNKPRLLNNKICQIWWWSSCSKVLFLPGWTRTLLSRTGLNQENMKYPETSIWYFAAIDTATLWGSQWNNFHFYILKFQSYTLFDCFNFRASP